MAECYASIDGIGFLFEDVQLTTSRDARVRAPFGDGVKPGVLVRSVTNDPEAHQGMEDRS